MGLESSKGLRVEVGFCWWWCFFSFVGSGLLSVFLLFGAAFFFFRFQGCKGFQRFRGFRVFSV